MCDVPECDCEASILRRTLPTTRCCDMATENYYCALNLLAPEFDI